ncbi:MAG: VOC family protein [Chitinophagaceae bacterium]|nr:VOC family protein [Chitinophagaceae bacterium]
MQLKEITPMLWVDDVRATIDYYVSVLGFDEGNYLEDAGWGVVEKHKVRIMLTKPNEHLSYEKPVFTGSLYIRTEDADVWWHFLKDKTDVLYPIEDFAYGMREFAIRDCNGYILQFGHDIGT